MTTEATGRECTTCGKWKPLDQFWRYKAGKFGRRSSCAVCSSAEVRRRANRRREENYERERAKERAKEAKRREKRKEYDRKRAQTPQWKAREQLKSAVRRGDILKPTACEDCGKELPSRLIHGHHHDYSKPLEVEWLCTRCHGRRHRVSTDSEGQG